MTKWTEKLKEWNQSHIFKAWEDRIEEPARKLAFFKQLEQLDQKYPGGLSTYISNARHLLQTCERGENPFEGWHPSIPTGENVSFDTIEEIEDIGMREIGKCAFVLVAGGLGERLGYSGIKIELPVEMLTKRSYLQIYIERLLALQHDVPLVIMVSEDTEKATLELLQKNGYFGTQKDQITLFRQEKVASFMDNKATLAMADPFTILTKPHGHGDVHMLLHQQGIVSKWLEQGREWVIFFQDTNAQACNGFVPLLGVSKKHDFVVNSAAIRRRAKDASGGLVRLSHDDGRNMTINIEYNQLDPLLRNTINPKGDVNGPDGYSCFPGNINLIALALKPYNETLIRTGGVLGEFINPKYVDPNTRTEFKKPARLECMMQDYPKALSPTDRVGFTVMESWLVYSPCKNNLLDAASKVKQGIPGQCASTAEHDYYLGNALMLESIGVPNLTSYPDVAFHTIPVFNGPRIVWNSDFAVTRSMLRSRFPYPEKVSIVGSQSVLILEGSGIEIQSLHITGAVRIKACEGATVIIRSLRIQNEGVQFIEQSNATNEIEAMRGYSVDFSEKRFRLLEFATPGHYEIDD